MYLRNYHSTITADDEQEEQEDGSRATPHQSENEEMKSAAA